MSVSVWDRFPQLKQIPKEMFPNHVLIIPDGNGRWAQRMNKPLIIGHKKGYQVLKEALEILQDLPINIVTIWGFASDNWKRSKQETENLMKLFKTAIENNLNPLLKKNTKFIHLGRKDRIPDYLKQTITKAEQETLNNNRRIFCLAIDFGGEDQILRMMKKTNKLPKNTKLTIDLVKKLRDGHGEIPPADLIIRTSGEQRISDIGWLGTNAEFYSVPKFLPQAQISDFIEAIIDYSKRNRRFGGRP
mgnify:FL=1